MPWLWLLHAKRELDILPNEFRFQCCSTPVLPCSAATIITRDDAPLILSLSAAFRQFSHKLVSHHDQEHVIGGFFWGFFFFQCDYTINRPYTAWSWI